MALLSNAKGEVQQFMNNETYNILYFEDRAVFILNSVDSFSSIIHAVK